MNDFSELEAELKNISPVATSPDLVTRIERGMERAEAATQSAGVARRTRFQINWLPLGLGLAAATAFLLLARVNVDRTPNALKMTAAASPAASITSANPNTNTSFVPTGMTQVVYNTRDEGLVFANGADEPVRRVRSRKRETLRWKNPGTGASLEVSYPSEETKFIPVPGQ
ncbi:MAG: hypothetical protein ACR2MF_02925 [Chthoniobacterales bacterium]